ncbi:MAG TPA: amidohydrolase family protein [Gemmatimonadaceae bacterium]
MRVPVLLMTMTAAVPATAQQRLPIIDMHLHALAADQQGPPPLAICTPLGTFPAWDQRKPYPEAFLARFKTPWCSDPVWSPITDDSVRDETIAAVERLNIIGVLSGTPERVANWMAAAPGRFIPALAFQLESDEAISPDSIRALHAAGCLAVFGEITNQYAGIAPDDERMEPYWTLAEQLDVPVGIHIGPGPPGVIYLGAAGYRARLHSALSLEDVLARHPRLRIYIMHAGYPMLDDLVAVLYAHPQVYVDVGVIVFTQPREAFYRYLSGIVEAGYVERVMFGSDQMVWPGVIERSVAVIEEAPFLSAEQKRAIFYDNAARFLRLSDEEKARHRRQ